MESGDELGLEPEAAKVSTFASTDLADLSANSVLGSFSLGNKMC